LLFENRVKIGRVNAGNRGLCGKLKWNTFWLVELISAGDVHRKRTVVELRSLRRESNLNNGGTARCDRTDCRCDRVLADLNRLIIDWCFFTALSACLCGWSSLRVRLLTGSSFGVFFAFSAKQTLFSLFLTLLANFVLFIIIVVVTNGVFELKETLIANLELASNVLSILHGAKVQVLQRCQRILAVNSVHVDQDRDRLMLLILITL